jgi:transposase
VENELKLELYEEKLKNISSDKLIFIDECGVNLNLSPLYGRAATNERCYDEKPIGRGKRISMVGGLSLSGMEAAFTFEGTMDEHIFLHFLEHHLYPTLKEGDYIVMDNASVHHSIEVRVFLEDHGINFLYLPPYMPELNPIELVWNKMKTLIKKIRARTIDNLYDAYENALNQITDDNVKKFFEHAFEFSI